MISTILSFLVTRSVVNPDRATFAWPWNSIQNLLHGPMCGKIKTKLLLIPATETPNMGSKHFDCPITLLHFKLRQSKTFQKVPWRDDGKMTVFASVFAKPMKIRARLFLFDKPNVLHFSLERLSYDLEKVFAVCFTDQCLARLKQSFSLFPPRKLLIWEVNSAIAQSHYWISNDVKAKLSRKFHGEMTFFASASANYAKPMKIHARLFLFH